MATVNVAYTSEQTMTVTNLHSLASSATAGWGGPAIDNTSNKYLDAIVQFILDPANTAPANDKCFYLFAWGCHTTSRYPSTGASSGGTVGTQGALTFPNITTTPILLKPMRPILYGVADTVITAPAQSICEVLGLRVLPPYWGVALLNYSGAALAASGNVVSWIGITETVA